MTTAAARRVLERTRGRAVTTAMVTRFNCATRTDRTRVRTPCSPAESPRPDSEARWGACRFPHESAGSVTNEVVELSTRLVSLCFDATDPLRLARFWAACLLWEIDDQTAEAIALVPTDGTRLPFLFVPVREPKAGKSRIHLDLVSESPEHQSEMVRRLITLGAQHVDIGQSSEEEHVVLADPEGNEFCVVLRGDFLATTDLVGSIVFEPADPVVGRFWSEAAGWPIVYDQDGDTAIRAPDGRGPFVTFGPPTGAAKTGKNRLHLDIAPPADGNQAAEVERLIALGARRVDIGQGDVSWVVMADPEGNEFCVLTPR